MQVLISVDPDSPSDLERATQLVAQLRTSLNTVSATTVAAPPKEEDADGGASATTPSSQADMFDHALAYLYDDGTDRQGSLRFLEEALKYPPGVGYTIPEIAEALGESEAEVKAYRRNLGRALGWIRRNELPAMPDFFDWWVDGGTNHYELIDGVRAAAQRRGLI